MICYLIQWHSDILKDNFSVQIFYEATLVITLPDRKIMSLFQTHINPTLRTHLSAINTALTSLETLLQFFWSKTCFADSFQFHPSLHFSCFSLSLSHSAVGLPPLLNIAILGECTCHSHIPLHCWLADSSEALSGQKSLWSHSHTENHALTTISQVL